MSVNLLASNTAKVDFGDIADLGTSLTTISVALTFKPTAATVSNRRLFGQWGNTSPSWLVYVPDTDEMEFLITNGIGNFFGRKTSTLNLASGTTYRAVCTYDSSGGGSMHIYVNGTDFSLTADGSSNVALADSVRTVAAGRETDSSTNGADGDYSELAIWDRVLSLEEAVAYGQGYSPEFFRFRGLHYWRLLDTSSLTDSWGSANGTNSGGTDATHPTVIMPGGAVLNNLSEFGLKVESVAGNIRVTQAFVDFLVSDPAGTVPSLVLFDHHYKQQGMR